MSGAIMPLPLAMPLIRTSAPPMLASRVAALGNVSVVMMPRAAFSHASGRSARAARAGRRSGARATALRRSRRWSQKYLRGAADEARGGTAVAFAASAPARPVNTLALPALTTSARARPPASAARHQSTGAPGHLLRVNTPATVCRREFGQHQVGAALVADAGGGGAEPHPRQRRQFRRINGQRRDGRGMPMSLRPRRRRRLGAVGRARHRAVDVEFLHFRRGAGAGEQLLHASWIISLRVPRAPGRSWAAARCGAPPPG